MYIKVIVTPNAKKESFRVTGENRYAISVKEPAERNLANNAVVLKVAEHLQVPVANIRIVSGHHSPSKMLSVREV